MRQKEDEEAMKTLVNKQFSELELRTNFKLKDFKILWSQYIGVDPFLAHGSGMDYEQFAQFVGGTFSEWWVDEEIVKKLWVMTDVEKDGLVDFPELVMLLSVVCRGTLRDVVTCTCRFSVYLSL